MPEQLPSDQALPNMSYESKRLLQLTTNQGRVLIGITCMFLTLCTAAVVGRVVARRMVKARLMVDDYLAFAALTLLVVLSINQFLLCSYLLTFSKTTPTDPIILQDLPKLEIACQISYILLITLGRASVLFLYRRVITLHNRLFALAWYIVTSFSFGFCIALLVTLVFQCDGRALSTLWQQPEKCVTKHVAPAAMGYTNAGLDFLVLLLPMRMVWMLQLPVKRKLAVCGIFGLGVIGVAVSIARATAFSTSMALTSESGGPTFAIWSTAEAAVALLCACLPLLRPIFSKACDKVTTVRTKSVDSGVLLKASQNEVVGTRKVNVDKTLPRTPSSVYSQSWS